ncbi:component of gems protein 1-like [Bombina bombina]|uniref:component of gems protein 1-like n=1 Tax=Bombina bombina TaxID=8345 RepID=UPI00235B2568|nr:component of gems protein 1-like [Bombina bombina]
MEIYSQEYWPIQTTLEVNTEISENASGDREIQSSHDNDIKQGTYFSNNKHRPTHRSNYRQFRRQEYTYPYSNYHYSQNRLHQIRSEKYDQPHYHQQYPQTRQESWNRQPYYNRYEYNRNESWNRQYRPDNFNQYDQHHRRDNFNQYDQHHRRDSYSRNYETPRFHKSNQREKESNNPRFREQRPYHSDFRANSPLRHKTGDHDHKKTSHNNFQHNNRFFPLAFTSDENVFLERHARNNSNSAAISPFLGNTPTSGRNPPDEQNLKKRPFHTDQEGQEVEALPPRKKNHKN